MTDRAASRDRPTARAPGVRGETDGELRPLAGLALHVDRPLVGLDDLAGRRQSQAAAARSRGEERLEDPASDLLGHPHARVGHVQDDPAPLAPGREDQLAPGGHGVLGVEHQVQQGLLEQVGVESDRRQIGGELGPHHDRLGRRMGLVEVADLLDDLVEVHEFQLQVLDAGEAEEVLEDAMQPEDLVLEPLDPLADPAVARGLAVLKILGQEVEVQPERGQGIADLVG